ncbi:hypothetical protein QYZ88_007495 [Lachnospiraceae bacterium C1.1]|nr:hypothetical protein [Lachnospiraceae bacterium C1.1]
MIGSYIDRHYLNYEIPVSEKASNLPMLTCIGAVIMFAWKELFAPATIVMALGTHWGNMLAMGLMTLFALTVWPVVIMKETGKDENTYWSGDQRDGMHYNEMVDIKDYPDLDKENSEHIVDYDYPYQYCLNISFNEDGTPGKGSAIFLHCFGPEKPYTGGCVAVPENIMKITMKTVKKDCVIIIDTMDNLTGRR